MTHKKPMSMKFKFVDFDGRINEFVLLLYIKSQINAPRTKYMFKKFNFYFIKSQTCFEF